MIEIDGYEISEHSAPYIIAEISANHNGKIENAFNIIDMAERAGANAVKMQTYTPDTITLNARKPDFKLDAKASTYLFAVVRNLWLKQLDKRKRKTKLEDSHEQIQKTEDKHATFDLALVRKELNNMGDLCRKILLMYFFDGYDMKTIAEANDLSNANTAKSKKYQCLKELTHKVKSQYQKSDFL